MRHSDFHREKHILRGREKALTQKPFLRYFVCDEKNDANCSVFIQGIGAESFWWDVVNSAFLQPTTSEEAASGVRPNRMSKRKLSPFGAHLGFDLRHHYGTAAYQQDRDPAIQRGLLGNAGARTFSGPVDAPSFSQAPDASTNSTTGAAPRQLAKLSVCQAQGAPQPDLRHRLDCYCYLRKGRKGSRRIQSQETRASLLSSAFLFRSPPAGVLAWEIASRQRGQFHRHYPLLESVPGQSSAKDGTQPHPFSHGRRVLQPSCRRIPRRERMWLCHRGQGACTLAGSHAANQIPLPEQRLGGRRVPLSTPEMGSYAPFHCRATSHYGGSSGSQATEALHRSEICLPCFRDQSCCQPVEGLSLLQCSRRNGEEQPGTPL